MPLKHQYQYQPQVNMVILNDRMVGCSHLRGQGGSDGGEGSGR